MSQNRRSHSRRFGTSPAARRFRLHDIEVLEERRLLTSVQWISKSSGNWDVASNWSTNKVPGSGDDVTINVGGATPTITIDSGNQSVRSLSASDPLSITGGALEVSANSTIGGTLSMTGGSLTVNGSGVTSRCDRNDDDRREQPLYERRDAGPAVDDHPVGPGDDPGQRRHRSTSPRSPPSPAPAVTTT